MITVTLSRSDLDTTLLALRYLQERLGELPQEFMDLLEGGCPDEAEIDDICARLAGKVSLRQGRRLSPHPHQADWEVPFLEQAASPVAGLSWRSQWLMHL
jgi:hypothetical protein